MTLSEQLLRLATCPKCGKFVTLDNNGALFDLLLKKQSLPQLLPLATMQAYLLLRLATRQAFHLLPVEQQGVVCCMGSPSRAQYLPGQPRDMRSGIIYKPERESIKRAAFAQMQELCSVMTAMLNVADTSNI